VGNVSKNVYAKLRYASLRTGIKKALGIFRELITTSTRTTRVAFWDPTSRSKNNGNVNETDAIKTINDNNVQLGISPYPGPCYVGRDI